MDAPPIDLERFATLSAELDAGAPRDELCAREGISVDQWVAAQEAWLARMADETARKRFTLTNRYNNAFVARRRAITHGAPAPPPRRAPKAVEAPALADPIEPPEAPAPALPSFAIAKDPPVIANLDPPRIEAPAIVAPPFVPPSPAVVPEPRPPRAATMAIPVYVEPADAPLPFKKDAPPAPPPPKDPPRPPPQDLGGTTVGAMSPFAEVRSPLPFQASGSAKASPSRPAVVDLESTTATGSSPLKDARAALPFQSGAAASPPPKPPPPPPPPPKPPAPPAAPRSHPPADPPGESTVYGVSPFAAGAAPLPFKSTGMGSSPALQPRLTLEQFASLTAEIAVAPHGAAQIRARYGFDEASHAAEAEAHNRRFSADKPLFERYLALVQQYREYVARAKR